MFSAVPECLPCQDPAVEMRSCMGEGYFSAEDKLTGFGWCVLGSEMNDNSPSVDDVGKRKAALVILSYDPLKL